MASLQSDIPVSIRINPFKQADLSYLDFDGEVPWCEWGRYLRERPSFTLDPLFHAGAYYVQDSSAMFVGWMLRRALDYLRARSEEDGVLMNTCTALDLCAAPGGKTTDASTALRECFGSSFLLLSNEVIRQRSSVLEDNVARWGDPNVVVCNSDPEAFASLEGLFDLVIADVPCSGEGMFRKSENARNMWSEDNVALCAARSRRIVGDVWNSLAEGGVLVYSTCTLNREENDDNVAWFIEHLGARPLVPDMPFEGPEATEYGFLLTPGKVRGEGQYCAILIKDGAFVPDRPLSGGSSRRNSLRSLRRDSSLDALQSPSHGSCADSSEANPEDASIGFFSRNDEIIALPAFLEPRMEMLGKSLKLLNAGTRAFVLKGRDKIPHADLALSLILKDDDFPSVELDRTDALRFLHRDALVLENAPKSYILVTYRGMPLGFVKNLGNRANNLLPAGRRILMNVE